MPRRTSIALALLATACAGPQTPPPVVAAPAAAVEPAPLSLAAENPSSAATERAPELAPSGPPEPEPAATAASQVPPPPTTSQSAAEDVAAVAKKQLQERLIRLVEGWDLATARALIDDALTSPSIIEARVLLEHNRAEEALLVSERAVAAAPGEPRALLVLGEANLRVGLARGDAQLLERALTAFQQSGPSAAALFGASRAARALARNDEALRYAQDGWRELAGAPAQTAELVASGEMPERTLAEAHWNAWIAAREIDDVARSEKFAEIEAALARCVARAPRESWGWTRLAQLYRDVGRTADERGTLERALAARPDDASLYEALANSFEGDGAAALAYFERLQRQQPQSPLPWWHAAQRRLDLALDTLEPATLPALVTAEREFATSRVRGRTTLGRPLEQEALCRIAMGWCRLRGGDLEAAASSFRSAEQLFSGAMRLDAEPRLSSGVDGLSAVADARAQLDDLGAAAELYAELHRYEPSDVSFARRAGELFRDSGERVQGVGIDCVKIGRGKISDARRIRELRERVAIDPLITSRDALRREFERKGEHWQNRARVLFEESYRAFLDAVALAPDDMRTLADCAAIPLYHLKTDLERAERLLRKAVLLGENGAAGATLDEATAKARLEAWGDAHQYLGKLYLEHKQDPRTARAWFQKSLEIGPDPRTEITEKYLPLCEKQLQAK